jgi:fumarate reductase subunit D
MNRFDSAVLDTLLPSGSDPLLPLGLLESGFDEWWTASSADVAPPIRLAFRLGLFAGAWVAPVLIGRLRPLNMLSASDRERALTAMERSRITALRQLVRILKTVAALHYGAHPDVRRAIGYHA